MQQLYLIIYYCVESQLKYLFHLVYRASYFLYEIRWV